MTGPPSFAPLQPTATTQVDPAGMTASAPLNLGSGSTVTGGVNTATFLANGGPDVNFFGGALTMLFQGFKHWKRFDQQRFAQPALVVFGVAIGIVVFVILGHQDIPGGIAKGCAIAVNAWSNYVGVQAAGLPGLPAAADPV